MLLRGHERAFACPRCRGSLLLDAAGARCDACPRIYPVRHGFVDFAPDVTTPSSYGQAIMESPMHVSIYETTIRPHFVGLMAKLWTASFGERDEHEYIRTFLQPVDGPVVDLACGTGRWTKTVAETVGRERTIGMDISVAMLRYAQHACAELQFVRGTGQSLPFHNASLGGMNCWAALQLMPEPKTTLREIGRCLRPGGSFTCFTFRKSPDPVYRYFQETHAPGLPVFEDADIRRWTNDAGMEITDISGPDLALLFTARRS